MKKKKKILHFLIIFTLFICISSLCINDTYALNFQAGDWKPSEMTGSDSVKDMGNVIIGVMQIVGSLISVIALAIIAIRYIIGSVEEKAQYKELLLPYLVGAILVFGISNILPIIYDMAKGIG